MRDMERMRFETSEIVVRDRMRSTINEDAVAQLMASMERIGLQVPISVTLENDEVVLVAGCHRLEAASRLGWGLIDCIIHTDAQQAKLWEIAENLHRAELTEAERRQHISEWVRLTAEKVAHSGPPSSGGAQPLEQGVRKAAKELGLPRTTVQRAVAAESLPDDVKAAADAVGLGTVKRAKLAALPRDQQAAAIHNMQVRPVSAFKRDESPDARTRRIFLLGVFYAGAVGRLSDNEGHHCPPYLQQQIYDRLLEELRAHGIELPDVQCDDAQDDDVQAGWLGAVQQIDGARTNGNYHSFQLIKEMLPAAKVEHKRALARRRRAKP